MPQLLAPLEKPLPAALPKPFVILLAGVNGAGKTTTIAKLTRLFQSQGKSVLLAAGDTFRAAAREQLAEWGERHGVTVVSQEKGDSAAVIFDAVQSARAKGIDVVLADTAGRLPTQLHLMDEIRKVKRVIAKADPGAPHETWLVLDANTGQNAVQQVKAFDEALGLTGLIVTKLDGTAKGGALAAIAHGAPDPGALHRRGREGRRPAGASSPRSSSRRCSRDPVLRRRPSATRRSRGAARVSCEIGAGEMVAVTGHSGAGKSTLLKLAAGIERATAGSVVIHGQNLAALGETALAVLRRRIGFVFQDHKLLFDRSAYDNVALPLRIAGFTRAETGRRVRAALDKVGLLDAREGDAGGALGRRAAAPVHRARHREPPLDPHRRRAHGQPRRRVRARDRRALRVVQPGGRDGAHLVARRSEPGAPRRAGASRSPRGRSPHEDWLRLHGQALAAAAARASRAQPFATALSVLVIAIAIALPVLAAVVLKSVGRGHRGPRHRSARERLPRAGRHRRGGAQARAARCVRTPTPPRCASSRARRRWRS